ncbi:AraC family transcriptional regulator of adaptative response/methylated-DNA-[protein]-cysteine methyltransferase [Sphingobium sp. OAS761]|uniref:bifunctional DNA-binding transcriptional regulator/O6-methylguanine-DNA methyltransferase Ada n=1 Tax=Sphingobium sp. OAS761 TaxID=2817901 RepID=UPI00209E7ECF|nr:bifunctional DNA-binding transcriptional regulator/O6-methylguanine-DNA methyltransferase Ada [Sphingobium sp. OAS761]MCP1471197.1 AraC family transcriptional regulator of adaptative response/methylated-DNA-[protein]-cysteine methyltransferase [Sphingobium sp. OAS761]
MNQMTRLAPSSTPPMPDPDTCWQAFLRRDRTMDGRFVGCVSTTGIYCKPSCPARHPRRDNMRFLPDGTAARAAGYRACLRCRPDEQGRDRQAVQAAVALIEAAEDAPRLEALAAHVGYAPHHFHRLFKRETGLTPAAFARAIRTERLKDALSEGGSVTAAIYEAGYNAPSRAYADAARHLGMTPSAWKDGGRGVRIRWCIISTSLGPILVAATDKGLCRISFDEGGADLRSRFPHADLQPADAALDALAGAVAALVENPAAGADLPVDVGGTAFQQAIWAALRAIPPGETRSYGDIAAATGRPGAVRAAGTACGSNHLAIVIPCHRVVRGDGGMGGYAWGVERKRTLLAREEQ